MSMKYSKLAETKKIKLFLAYLSYLGLLDLLLELDEELLELELLIVDLPIDPEGDE